ncbi:MAG: hypothetical protein SH848_00225 [Saprospiraceae bacterium]|nr:hypothetical protein [Saprospiraceae bacterium]
MMRNRLLPTHIFAILMIAVSIFLLITARGLHQALAQNEDSSTSPIVAFRNAFTLVAITLIVLCIGLIALKKWAIPGFLVMLCLGGITLAWGIYWLAGELKNEPTPLKIVVGFSVLIYTLLISGILFLTNAQVLALFHRKEKPKEEMPDILDQF